MLNLQSQQVFFITKWFTWNWVSGKKVIPLSKSLYLAFFHYFCQEVADSMAAGVTLPSIAPLISTTETDLQRTNFFPMNTLAQSVQWEILYLCYVDDVDNFHIFYASRS